MSTIGANATWASHHPDLQKACFFRRICQAAPPKAYKLADIKGQLQEGPTCGLATISMLFDQKVHPDTLLKQAVALKFTNNGEMFSAANLLELIRLQESSEQFELNIHEGDLDCDDIKQALISGSVMLVPYDPDVDHTPSLQKGHKAHWCLVVGYLIDAADDEFYVLARHGKSKLLAAWKLTRLSDSNANLNEFAQPRNHEGKIFLLPEGGIGGPRGLCRKSIIVKRRS